MKNAILWALAIAVVALGCYVSYASGYKQGHSRACSNGCPMPPGAIVSTVPPPPKTVQHNYEFKQNGASIYRFDLGTGEACWMQLSVADRNTPLPRCPLQPPAFIPDH